MRAFRKLLARTPLYGVYKSLGHYPDYWYWKLRGQPVRSPHLVKQRTVREYAEKFGLRTLVETGTYYGEMVAAMKNRFAQIYSVEFDRQLAQRALKKFSRRPHIHILEGDSQQVVPTLLQKINEPALFWLDAGYYGWAGLQGDKQRLTTELEAILRHSVKGHVILMDDARGLNGQNGSPTVEGLKQRIESQFPGRHAEVKHDILRITGLSGLP
ncbi:MAG TPA: class I SAM-dependent methyltransferase [Candidatus Angelobacter sp.]